MIAEGADPLRVGVVGAGEMGRNHLRAYSSLRGVELVAVADTDTALARSVAESYGCQFFSAPHELVGVVDAATIAVPSVAHAEVGSLLLREGIHCLIEKPLAPTEDGCDALLSAAEDGGAVLMAGHIERFNPAVQQMMHMISSGERTVYAMDARRMSSVSSRITDVDVVMDLMIHDIDIVTASIGEPVVDVTARGISVAGRGCDYATTLLQFKGGALATLTASRITQNKVRELHISTDDGLIVVDYSTRELLLYRQGQRGGRKDVGLEGGYVLDLAMERILLPGGEPLVLELQHFVECVVTGNEPVVSGRVALDALRIGWQIHDQLAYLGDR